MLVEIEMMEWQLFGVVMMIAGHLNVPGCHTDWHVRDFDICLA